MYMRKTYASLGDDATLTRFVKDYHAPPSRGKSPPAPDNPALVHGRTLYPQTVKQMSEVGNVFSSGHNTAKIGRDVRKGAFKGYFIYTLSLEERATCPPTCYHWNNCYGNNMHRAKRMKHGPSLERVIERDIAALINKRGRKGVLIRLHELGDFYSIGYVRLWGAMLEKYPTLAIFGYTARSPHESIGVTIRHMKQRFGRRFAVRFSNRALNRDATISIPTPGDCPPNAFVCPEQTGLTQCCATCGACWTGTKNVAFVVH